MGESVIVQVPIVRGYHGESYLLETVYVMDFLPLVGESIHCMRNDPDSGMTFEVLRRWWDERGKTVLEIGKFIIDPEDDGVHLPRTWNAWYTDRDGGDLVEKLLNNGWRHYRVGGPDG
jgi:hypothetical protein